MRVGGISGICLLGSRGTDEMTSGTRCMREMFLQQCICPTPLTCFCLGGQRYETPVIILPILFPWLPSPSPTYLPTYLSLGSQELSEARNTKQLQDRIQMIFPLWVSISTSVKWSVRQDELQVLSLAAVSFYESHPKGIRPYILCI